MATIAPRPAAQLQVVELCHVRPKELKSLWEREIRTWREALDWDVSGAMGALQRAVARGGINGRAVRYNGRIIAYGYYVVEGDRGVLSGLVVTPSPQSATVGRALVKSILLELERRGVRRIESQFICFDAPWLAACFEEHGFKSFWREFLRVPVSPRPVATATTDGVVILPWTAWNMSEMASLMMQSHRGGIDAHMNELYRTSDGCRILLNNIIRQRGCGNSVAEASSIARTKDTDVAAGFAIVTEIAPRHGHLAQVAVAPVSQGRGVGRRLLAHSLTRLHALGLTRLSLMVSSGNEPARSLYRSVGFKPVYRFPVFNRET